MEHAAVRYWIQGRAFDNDVPEPNMLHILQLPINTRMFIVILYLIVVINLTYPSTRSYKLNREFGTIFRYLLFLHCRSKKERKTK